MCHLFPDVALTDKHILSACQRRVQGDKGRAGETEKEMTERQKSEFPLFTPRGQSCCKPTWKASTLTKTRWRSVAGRRRCWRSVFWSFLWLLELKVVGQKWPYSGGLVWVTGLGLDREMADRCQGPQPVGAKGRLSYLGASLGSD